MLPKLNFPQNDFRFKKNEKGLLMIFDEIRKKFVDLTPEEWVRQNLLSFLINQKNYPKSLFSLESGMKLNNTKKRTDLIVFNKQLEPYILAECKAPEVKITEKVVEQALRYNLVHNAQFIAITNGIQHLYFHNISGKMNQISELYDYE